MRDFDDGANIVDDSGVRGATRGNNREDARILVEGAGEVGAAQMAALVHRDGDDFDVEQARCAADRRVGAARAGDLEARRGGDRR